MLGELGSVSCRLADLESKFMHILGAGIFTDQKVGVPEDHGEIIVEIVSNPSGELTHHLQPFGVVKLLLQPSLRCDIRPDCNGQGRLIVQSCDDMNA